MTNGLQHTGAFVVQFKAETELPDGLATGRVEHVASGRAINFSSLAELLEFVGRLLSETRSANSK